VGTSKRERQKANRQQRLEELAKAARRNKSRRVGVTVSIVVIGGLLLLFGLAWIVGDDDDEPSTSTAPTSAVEGPFVYGDGPCPAADGSSAPPETFEAPQKCIDETKGYVAEIVTNKGSFEITLDAQASPGNVNNFVTLVRYGYYTDNTCHRIIKDFVVQCGRDESGSETLPGYTVNDELPDLGEYIDGVVAVANTGQPNSGSGQFFIIVGADGASLPPQYTILGRVTKGYETTVADLENLADPAAENGVPPLEDIVIESATIKELDAPPTTTIPATTTTTTDPDAPTTTAAPTTTEGPTTTVAEAFQFGTGPCPAADGSSEKPETFEAPQKCIDESKGYVATVNTDKGSFEIALDARKSPGGVNNFVTLARYGYYTGTGCPRIVKDGVVQCGAASGGGPGYTITPELPSEGEYSEGVVAIYNDAQSTAGEQFVIIVGEQGAALPAQYTIIGRVTKGYFSTVAVLEGLADALSSDGTPLVDVTVESVTIEELDEPPTTTVPTTTSTTTTTVETDSSDVDATADIPTST
jgi:cyclophilin family peptidyl-prolyl cis-trans isomerase